MSFCRLRTCLQSAACVALKILRRSRCTCASWPRHLIASQSSRSPGPFNVSPPTWSAARSTVTAVASCGTSSNLPIRFQRFVGYDSSKGHPAHVSSLSGPGTNTRYAASYTQTTVAGGSGHVSVPSCRLSTAAVRFLAVLSRHGVPPPLRLAYRRMVVPPDLTGFPCFAVVSCDRCRAPPLPPLYPGTVVLSWPTLQLRPPLPPPSGGPCSSVPHSISRGLRSRGLRGFTIFALPAFPLPVTNG